MDDYLTSKQLQKLLKVDRITIYRMLNDGRLKGIKIGQQWRFPAREVEALLSGEIGAPPEQASLTSNNFPSHCVRAIQNVLAEIAQVAVLTIDLEGNALTETSHPCAFCKMIQSSATGAKACQESIRKIVYNSQKGQAFISCHAGLQYTRARVELEGKTIAFLLSGQYYTQQPQSSEQEHRVNHLAAEHKLDAARLAQAARSIPVLSSHTRPLIQSWTNNVVEAINSILRERAGLVDRLQKIAEISSTSS